MGRRKIEIKPIKDDRNRSVTFLKRKGGLFKKAHELSVLCSVDVAVIIFGSNKKLHEYSSTDIQEMLQRYQYYGGPNEHKGPADFNGKNDDDDDDDEMGTPPSHAGSVEPQIMHSQFPNASSFPHIRHPASESPPVPNGVPFHPLQRPQPQPGSRPGSRNSIRRTSSNLAPPQMAQPGHPPPPNGFAYIPNPPLYQPQPGAVMPHPHQGPPYPYPGHHGPTPQHPQHPHMPHVYVDDRRQQPMPPNFPQDRQVPVRASPQPQVQIQHHTPPQPVSVQIPQQHSQPPPPPPPQPMSQPRSEPQQQQQQHILIVEPVKRLPAKSGSIFTPIDEDRSVLSQHWQTSSAEVLRSDAITSNRSHSVDVGAVARNGVQPSPPPPPSRSQTNTTQPPPVKRNVSMSSITSLPDQLKPPMRTNSASQRPRLKVQIPDEASEGEPTADPSSRGSAEANGTNAIRRAPETNTLPSAGVVLPPPSPSANSLLSAGATGPPNPFARPHPPQSQLRGDIVETPQSALPSRYMGEYLPSPSNFFGAWDLRGSDSNNMHSPLNFQTPVVGTGPSFLREDRELASLKRKTPEPDEKSGSLGATSAANGVAVGDSKRAKHE